MNSTAETLTPVVENGGFTIVEQDDVAFSLSLCREIHRIYGSYQSGELEADDSVRLGLLLSAQMLSTLADAVTKGMPAMRLDVAAAQTREMVAVLLGEPITGKKPRAVRPRGETRCQRPIGTPTPTVQPIAGRGPAPVTAIASGQESGNNSDAVTDNESASSHHGDSQPVSRSRPEQGATTAAPISRLDRWRRSVRTMPWFIRLPLGILGCGLAAIAIDIPLVILLLFSNLLLPLSLCFASTAALAPRPSRRWISRLAHRSRRQ